MPNHACRFEVKLRWAVDMFYSGTGKPIITAITRHPTPKRSEYHHVLYYTNRGIFQRLHDRFQSFFIRLNEIMDLRSLPIHAEFKVPEGGEPIPVEFNPLRYGGFGLTDLSYYAHGQCPYFSFFQDEPYDWDGIWADSRHTNKHYAWVLAYKGAGIDTEEIWIKDVHARFREFIGTESLIEYQGLDYRKNPVFAIAYLAEEREERLTKWLEVEFRDFFPVQVPEK
uniref:ATP-grasp domain-containing protein n=1 Tax=Candidatus Kentrum sp. FW TaxID=2126338 RepID=A0A450SV69_9GAMM|nr:MAG: ATP-grasp domain-containing protein [Candidatus Kentron sp. FW]